MLASCAHLQSIEVFQKRDRSPRVVNKVFPFGAVDLSLNTILMETRENIVATIGDIEPVQAIGLRLLN